MRSKCGAFLLQDKCVAVAGVQGAALSLSSAGREGTVPSKKQVCTE